MSIRGVSKWRGGNSQYLDTVEEGVRDHFVYWFYDQNDRVLYVGCTRRPERRWVEHQQESKRMVAAVARKRMAGPYDYATARRIERSEQLRLRPIYGRKWKA